MTKYEYLMNRAEECKQKARTTSDEKLKSFYYNAAEGFTMKADNLTVREAGEQVK